MPFFPFLCTHPTERLENDSFLVGFFLPSTWEGKEKILTLINVYCPHAGKPERLAFKMRFYHLLQIRAEALLAAGRYCKPGQQGFFEFVSCAQLYVKLHWKGYGIFVF